ncbi:MAG: hypothetical protein JXX29_22425 [Deltaproteobacteria bacterium]|nr:hypothetical protein [Deltaproteobacteria bacterium]MBN2674453.1 hypothetical protein [Deltaproteobacteria bacterium]
MNKMLNAPGTIVFHPGIGKTATSAIQSIGLSLITDDTEQASFAPCGILHGAHNAFASNHPSFTPELFEEGWHQLLEYASSRNKSTIISSEFLIRDNPAHISELIRRCTVHGLPIKIVVAVRNYTGYLLSAYLQAVKVNWGIKDGEDVYAFARRELQFIRINQLVDHWARHIGDENVYLIDYDKHKSDIVSLFFKQFDIEIDKNNDRKKINPSIPLPAAELIRQFDQACSEGHEKRSEFIKYVSSLKFKEKFEHQIVSAMQNDIVKGTYAHDVERLNARYTWID